MNGYFFDRSRWDVNTEGRGMKIWTPLVLLVMPVVGLLFVMFLPVIGFYLSCQAIISKLGGNSVTRAPGELTRGIDGSHR